MVRAWSSRRTVAPSSSNTRHIMSMSDICGTFFITLVPCPSKAAAISFSAEFLAPYTCTSPDKGLGPATSITSWAAVFGVVYVSFSVNLVP